MAHTQPWNSELFPPAQWLNSTDFFAAATSTPLSSASYSGTDCLHRQMPCNESTSKMHVDNRYAIIIFEN